MAPVAMHKVPPHPTHGRRGTDGGDPVIWGGDDVRLTRLVLGPDALPPLPRPILPNPDPPSPNGRGSIATCGDVEPNPDAVTTDPREAQRQVLPLDTALLAPGIRGHFTLRPDNPGHTLWWCTRCGMSWRAAQVALTCLDGCAPVDAAPPEGATKAGCETGSW